MQEKNPALTNSVKRRVWDSGVRGFHWFLLAAVAISMLTGFFSGKLWLDYHLAAGTGVMTLVGFRIIWGFTGSTYARFASFVTSPLAAARHVIALARGEGGRHVGHNPVGAAMIMALLVVLVGLCLSGVVTLGGVTKDGPLAAFVPFAWGRIGHWLHEWLAYVLVGLVGLHVTGVLLESRRTRENLIGAMITGDKPAHPDAHGARQRAARPMLAGVVFGVVALGTAGILWQLSTQAALGVPRAAMPVEYARECGACHSPHHPSLAPGAVWQAMIAGLEDHFGDNAGLEPDVSQRLQSYLVANAAARWDTTAAHAFRERDPEMPLRITATPGWRIIHNGVAENVFKLKTVGGQLNCAACHRDALRGRFLPRAIIIPKQKETVN